MWGLSSGYSQEQWAGSIFRNVPAAIGSRDGLMSALTVSRIPPGHVGIRL